jgi:hypothetical protein
MVLKDSIAVLIAAGDRAPRKNAKAAQVSLKYCARPLHKNRSLGRGVSIKRCGSHGYAVPQGRRRGGEMTERRNENNGNDRGTVTYPRAGKPVVFRNTADPGVPPAQGLYDPALDKDSCGVGFIADIKGRKSHQIV